jgi:hypothetical protein
VDSPRLLKLEALTQEARIVTEMMYIVMARII